eukprot:gene6905-6981_t
MIERTLFQPDHQAFADSFRRFIDKEVTPHHAAWEDQGYVAREVWSQAGANGFLCMSLPEEYGGAGADKLYSVAQMEELARAGTTGIGFGLHSEILPWERLQIAITAVAAAQAAIDWTLDYVKQRKVFGQSVASFQNTRHTLAELQTQVQVARVFVDKCCELIVRDQLDTETASMAKYWTTDLQCKVMDECVQLFGGYGYMWEYPITRAYADARVQRIYGGTNEIMKEVIARAMGLGK